MFLFIFIFYYCFYKLLLLYDRIIFIEWNTNFVFFFTLFLTYINHRHFFFYHYIFNLLYIRVGVKPATSTITLPTTNRCKQIQ